METATSKARYEALDAWRGVCALLVALFHLPIEGHLYGLMLVRHAWLFVDFFFVLSGFVITHAYAKRLPRQTGSFIIRRIGRVWPLHIATLAAIVALELGGAAVLGGRSSEGRSLSEIPANLLLVQGWGFIPHVTWNYPSWSISVEVALYLSFAAFCLVPVRGRTCLAAALTAGGIGSIALLSPRYMFATADFGILRGVAGFYTGFLVYHLHCRVTLRGNFAVEAAAVTGVIFFVHWADDTPLSLAAPGIFGLAVWVFADSRGFLHHLATLPIFQQLGKWSFSIYMVHLAVMSVLIAALKILNPGWLIRGKAPYLANPQWIGDLLAVAYLLSVIGVAAISYRIVEVPGQRIAIRLTRNLGNRRQKKDHEISEGDPISGT